MSKQVFPRNISQYVKFFQAISDESRQKILLLLDKKNLSVNEISQLARLSQPNTSGHLSVLKNVGLVQANKKGNSVIYSINKKWFAKCCGDFLCNFEGMSFNKEVRICKE
ncbi:winged helix-turn-helix transcriptional regulator [Candidatus Roizmanbacteria bacterium]|nr:winged helix-turn-helix transcriptional regulator [Candidatus Roizmanbacteria bacterium]